jgi:hypothetical protein
MTCKHKNKHTEFHQAWSSEIVQNGGFDKVVTICADCGLKLKEVKVKYE